MSQNLRDYVKTIYTMDGVVRRVADGDWENQSPVSYTHLTLPTKA